MLLSTVAAIVLVFVLCAFAKRYKATHPIVFNESFWEHAHCLKQAGLEMSLYAHDNGGRFPFHTNGYGDALLLMTNAWLPSLTGPGFTAAPLERARANNSDVPETECGRVYVQGLSETNNHEIALLFDKRPSPGDHRHGPSRIWAPLVREVWTIGAGMNIIRESEWPAYAKKQIEMLVEAGIPRNEAEAYYADEKQ
jgi:hypothetical protein